MLHLVLIAIACVKFGDSAPFQYQMQNYQSAPQNYFNPFPQNAQYGQQAPQGYPLVYPYQFTGQNQNVQPLLRQEGFISGLPFLPIEINVIDVIRTIMKGLQSILGPNFPILGGLMGQPGRLPMGGVVDPQQDLSQQAGFDQQFNQRIGASGGMQILPIPMIFFLPQQQYQQFAQSSPTTGYEKAELKVNS